MPSWFRKHKQGETDQAEKYAPRPAVSPRTTQWTPVLYQADRRLAQHPDDLVALRRRVQALGKLERYEDALLTHLEVLRLAPERLFRRSLGRVADQQRPFRGQPGAPHRAF